MEEMFNGTLFIEVHCVRDGQACDGILIRPLNGCFGGSEYILEEYTRVPTTEDEADEILDAARYGAERSFWVDDDDCYHLGYSTQEEEEDHV